MEVPVKEPVFVWADDGLNIFPSIDALLGWIEAPDVEDGVYEAIFTLSGEVILATTRDGSVDLQPSGEVDLPALRSRLRESSHRFKSDPNDLRAVANELLKAEWDARWPKRPRWLARRLHGEGPAQV